MYKKWLISISALTMLITMGAGCYGPLMFRVDETTEDQPVSTSTTVEEWQTEQLEENDDVPGMLAVGFIPCVDEARLVEILEFIGPKDEIQVRVRVAIPDSQTSSNGGFTASTDQVIEQLGVKISEMEAKNNEINPNRDPLQFDSSTARIWMLVYPGTGAEGLAIRERFSEVSDVGISTNEDEVPGFSGNANAECKVQ